MNVTVSGRDGNLLRHTPTESGKESVYTMTNNFRFTLNTDVGIKTFESQAVYSEFNNLT